MKPGERSQSKDNSQTIAKQPVPPGDSRAHKEGEERRQSRSEEGAGQRKDRAASGLGLAMTRQPRKVRKPQPMRACHQDSLRRKHQTSQSEERPAKWSVQGQRTISVQRGWLKMGDRQKSPESNRGCVPGLLRGGLPPHSSPAPPHQMF